MQNLNSLIENLNRLCKRSLEEAAQLCVSQAHFTIDLEHVLQVMLDKPATDLSVILKYYEVNTKKALQQLKDTTAQFKRGNNKTPSMSPQVIKLLERAWIMSSLHLKQTQIRSAALLMALLKTEELLGTLMNSCPELLKIPRNQLEEDIRELIKSSPEDVDAPAQNGPSEQKSGSTQALDQFTIDLTALARQGKIDPIEGRDGEIRQMIDILSRRRQNNPILTGDAGVGKTAVVEGLALRIAEGHVPDSLKQVAVRTLDLGLLEAGAGIKGEFEQRLKSVIEEVQGSLKPIILFIDEAHMLIGGKEKNNDAANLLKPALARGELRTIAATTWDEYKRYFEKDPALTRRFQVVSVAEPDEPTAINMLRSLAHKLEQHHHVLILDQALQEAVKLSSRYIGGRRLPDKAVSLLDTACARVHVAQHAIPEPIELLTHTIEALQREEAMLVKEEASGHEDQSHKIKEIQTAVKQHQQELSEANTQWKEELALVKEIRTLQENLEENKDAKEKVRTLRKQLEEKQKTSHMVPLCVDNTVIAQVVSSWTGIPLGKMVRDEIKTLLALEEIMGKRLIGQKKALETLAKHIVTYRANLDEPGKPVGVFLLAGPSGIGKTETALALADSLYGGERNLITINMSEYQEAYTVSALKGSPPGYVGFGQGGILTEAVRRNPYSVVLLDEIEKAHTDVLELFYQVFDKGTLEDAEGIVVDFKNTIILMTTNLGSETIMSRPQEGVDSLLNAIRPGLLKHFKPALLGRMTVVPYLPLTEEEIHEIVRLKLDKIKGRFFENHQATFTYDQKVVDQIAGRCEDPDSGARAIDHIINQNILPLLSEKILKHVAEETPFDSIKLIVEKDGFSCAFSGKK